MREKEVMLEEKTELLHHYSIVIHEQARQFHTFIRDETPSQVFPPCSPPCLGSAPRSSRPPLPRACRCAPAPRLLSVPLPAAAVSG
eukprot:761230-Hanusia_phi.AAC.7